MIELETKKAIEEQEKIAINLARIVDRLDEIDRSIWLLQD